MRKSLVLAALVSAAVVAPRSSAQACHNSVERVLDATTRSVRLAETLLTHGAYQAAVKEALAAFPMVLQLTHRARRAGLFARAQRVVALAAVRSGGAVRLASHMSGKTASQKAANLAWAAMLLRMHHARTNDVVVQVELAEALAALPAERAEAYGLLKELGDGDVLPTARAWGLLAELARDRGDVGAAERADRRCREIAPKDGICDPEPGDA